MNDQPLGWAITGLEGVLEIVERQVKDRKGVDHGYVQRIEAVYERIEALHATMLEKQT